jgi:hypothetical protein
MTPMTKLARKLNGEYLTMELPTNGPKIAHGRVTRSRTACAVPLCLFGTISPIAARLFG